MPITSQNISMIRDPDFQKCGEIMVAPKRNTFAMSCLYCEDVFTRLPAFIRHLHQRHMDELQFEAKDAEVEVYAVEELVNRTLCGAEEDSEESGVADDDFNVSESEEDNERIKNLNKKGKINVDGKERSSARDVVKEATLGNMSILNALEDCDVSLNFVENLSNTIVDKQENEMEFKADECKETTDQENECQENGVETDEGMDEEDFDMNSTILKRIQVDLGIENDEDQVEITKEAIREAPSIMDLKEDNERNDDCNSSTEDDDQNVTLTESNVSKSLNTLSNSARVTGLKNLLSGLDDLDDVDYLLDNIEDSMLSKHQADTAQGNEQKSNEILRPTAANDIELDEFNLDASILKQCLADDDVEDVKEIVEKDNTNVSETDEEKTENGHISVLQLQVMADWDLDDIDLEDCLNSSGFVSRDPVKTNEAGKIDNILKTTPTSSRECKEVIEKPQTPMKKNIDLECVSTVESTNWATAGNGQLNTSSSPTFVKTTPKSSNILKNNKTTPKSQKTLKIQKESFSKQQTEALEKNVLDIMDVDGTQKTERGSGESRATANSLKSIQKTPKSSKNLKNCDQITPKLRKSVPTKNISKLKEVLAENETLIANIEEELLENNPNIAGKDNQISPKARKLTKAANRTAEDEKELETNKFEEGLSEDNSSTHMYEEYTESSEKCKGYSLHSLLNKSLDDEEDLDTLINQLERNADETIKDKNEITMTKEKVSTQNQDAVEEDNEEVSLEDEMTIFRKFIGLDTDKSIEKDEQIIANEEEDENDFENLLNEDLSKALEKALEEENIDMLKLYVDQPGLEADEENKISTPLQCERDNSHYEKKTLSNISSKASDMEHFQGKYTKTNQKARNIQGNTLKRLENALKHSNHNVLAPKLYNKRQLSDLQPQEIFDRNHVALLPQKLHETNSKSVQYPKKIKETRENSPVKSNFRKNPKSNLETEKQQNQAYIIKVKKEIVTPSRRFINMQRGERTPMKLQDLFLKQSPKTQEKSGEKPGNTLNETTPDNKTYKKSPSECKKNLSKMTTPKTRKTTPATKVSPQSCVVIKQTEKTSPQSLVANSSDSQSSDLNTPQRVRKLSIKLQRCPSYLNLNKSSENLTIPEEFETPPTKQQIPANKTSSLSAQERKNISSVFKLPNGITISKVNLNTSPTTVEVTPCRSNYCKQNFTEQQLVAFQDSKATESLIKSLPTSVTVTKTSTCLVSRFRARQASIDIVSSAKSPRKSSIDYKSYAVNRSERKKEVLQRMRTIKKQIFKSIQSNSLANSKIVKSPIPRKRKRSAIKIENIQILPNVQDAVLSPLLSAQHLSPQLSSVQENDIQSTPPKTSMQAAKTPSTGRRGGAVKRRAASPLEEECPKRVHKSPTEQQICRKAPELEATPLGLSESVEDLLQRDLKANPLNVDSILNKPMPVDDIAPDKTSQERPDKKDSLKLEDSKGSEELNTSDTNILDDILEQVTTEDTPDANKNTTKEGMTPSKCTVRDYDDAKDLELLGIVGLKIINDKDVEDMYNIEEVDEMRAKAQQFADICKQCLRIFSYSKLSEPVMLFKTMHASVNNIYNINLSINDIKRLVNLLVIWYTNCYNNKLIEKKPISQSTNYYLLILNFIPKTSKRLYYCEFCDEHFTTEHKYYTHRIQHTGAYYPYSCKNCPVGFLRSQSLKSHYLICTKRTEQIVADKTQQKVFKTTVNNDNKVSVTNYQNAVKYEHVNAVKKVVKPENLSGGPVKRRLHTVYKCAKCDMSFITESDVKLHLNSCNRNHRRQPKNCTPRPNPKV